MYVYRGNGFEGSTIVNFGVSLTVTNGQATVEYNGAVGRFEDVLMGGKLAGREGTVKLDKNQLAWLEESKTWVKYKIEE
jgi:hypothetical protein